MDLLLYVPPQHQSDANIWFACQKFWPPVLTCGTVQLETRTSNCKTGRPLSSCETINGKAERGRRLLLRETKKGPATQIHTPTTSATCLSPFPQLTEERTQIHRSTHSTFSFSFLSIPSDHSILWKWGLGNQERTDWLPQTLGSTHLPLVPFHSPPEGKPRMASSTLSLSTTLPSDHSSSSAL